MNQFYRKGPQDVFRPTSCFGKITGSRACAREPVNYELDEK